MTTNPYRYALNFLSPPLSLRLTCRVRDAMIPCLLFFFTLAVIRQRVPVVTDATALFSHVLYDVFTHPPVIFLVGLRFSFLEK